MADKEFDRRLDDLWAEIRRADPTVERVQTSWRDVFAREGFEVVGYIRGREEITPARRVLLIRSLRRDSYLLRAAPRA